MNPRRGPNPVSKCQPDIPERRVPIRLILDLDQVLHEACYFTRMLIHRVKEGFTNGKCRRYGELHDEAR